MEERPLIVAPSLLSADFTQVREAVAVIETSGAQWIHLDIMDGAFVPSITFGHKMVADIRSLTSLPLDVHLMVAHPEGQIPLFAAAGADWITVHLETKVPPLQFPQDLLPTSLQSEERLRARSLIDLIKKESCKAGLALCPATPLSAAASLFPEVDMVMLMGVNPGSSGQKMVDFAAKKAEALQTERDRAHLSFLIALDGGVTAANAPSLIRAGAEVLVSGSSFFKADSPKAFVAALQGNRPLAGAPSPAGAVAAQ